MSQNSDQEQKNEFAQNMKQLESADNSLEELAMQAKKAVFYEKWDKAKSLEGTYFDELEKNYEVSPQGVFKLHMTRNGQLEKCLVLRSPLMITGFYRDLEAQVFYAQLELYRRNSWQKLPLQSLEQISTTSKITSLANYGVQVTSTNARAVIDYLACYRNCVEGALPENIYMQKLGWQEDRFYLPGYKDEGIEFALGDEELYRALSKPGGEQMEWLKAACRLREENLYGRFILATAFAAPLLKKLHFKGNPLIMLLGKKGIGKTTMMRLAATAWGDESLVYTCNGTLNGFEMRAERLNDLPFFADEVQTIKNKKDFRDFVQGLIYNSFNGVGKLRATKEAKADRVKRWRNFMVLSSETPILDYKSLGGEKRRLLEITVKEGLTLEQIIYYNNVSAQHYGWAGKYFLSFLEKSDEALLQKAYQRILQELHKYDEGKNEATHVGVLAIVAMADYIMSFLFFHMEPREDETYTSNDLALRSAMVMSMLILNQLHTEDETELAEKLYEEIMNKVAMNYNSFGLVGAGKEVVLQNSSGRSYGFIWQDNVYILPPVFDDWTKEQPLSKGELRDLLKKNGYLLTDGSHNTKQARINYGGRTNGRYICLPYSNKQDE